jgi:hypothetical protein
VTSKKSPKSMISSPLPFPTRSQAPQSTNKQTIIVIVCHSRSTMISLLKLRDQPICLCALSRSASFKSCDRSESHLVNVSTCLRVELFTCAPTPKRRPGSFIGLIHSLEITRVSFACLFSSFIYLFYAPPLSLFLSPSLSITQNFQMTCNALADTCESSGVRKRSAAINEQIVDPIDFDRHFFVSKRRNISITTLMLLLSQVSTLYCLDSC